MNNNNIKGTESKESLAIMRNEMQSALPNAFTWTTSYDSQFFKGNIVIVPFLWRRK